MCMNRKTAEQMVKVAKVLKLWKGAITGAQYEAAVRNFGGEKQELPSWSTVKRHMLAAHLIQRSNACTYQEVFVSFDHDEQTERWEVLHRNYYTVRRNRLPSTAEGWMKVAA